jgi:hypothetical protein
MQQNNSYEGDEIKAVEIGEACNRHEIENYTKCWPEEPGEEDYLGDIRLDGRAILISYS